MLKFPFVKVEQGFHVHKWETSQLAGVAKALAKELQKPGVSTKAHVLASLKRVISKRKLSQVFTSSFDRRTYNLAAKDKKKVIQTRLHKAETFKTGALRATKAKRAVSRKELAISLARAVGPLLGWNALSMLELATEQACDKHAWPSFMKGSGSVLGPGAVSGANLILGRLKAAKTSSVTLADLVADFQWSCTAFRKYRSLVRKELSRLRRVRVCTKTAIAWKKGLIAAGEAMLRERDTGLEFCLCELWVR